jgi:hypothetical protein
MPQSSSTPEYLSVARFAPLAQTNRTTLTQAVRMGAVRPSAYVDARPLFAVRDLARVMKELRTK